MWSRAKELYDVRLKENFYVSTTSGANGKISQLFRMKYEELAKYCVPIGLHSEGDLRSIFLD